ncbi:unannotated protein [freshwater metagenome]|uniref:Unannotated protein n=1 Tax=freshwater metagenome TaxID=449393 RepID=A0A6J7DJK0_9ZZZZ
MRASWARAALVPALQSILARTNASTFVRTPAASPGIASMPSVTVAGAPASTAARAERWASGRADTADPADFDRAAYLERSSLVEPADPGWPALATARASRASASFCLRPRSVFFAFWSAVHATRYLCAALALTAVNARDFEAARVGTLGVASGFRLSGAAEGVFGRTSSGPPVTIGCGSPVRSSPAMSCSPAPAAGVGAT